MKKIAIFFLAVIIIVVGISYMYLKYKANYFEAKVENRQFESYENQEVSGSELTTIINKAIDNNKKNNVEKNENGKYLDNENNSIEIDLKMLDNDETYNMETIYNGGMDKFLQFYSDIKFKCSKLEYHGLTGKVKYMLFEQVTQ